MAHPLQLGTAAAFVAVDVKTLCAVLHQGVAKA